MALFAGDPTKPPGAGNPSNSTGTIGQYFDQLGGGMPGGGGGGGAPSGSNVFPFVYLGTRKRRKFRPGTEFNSHWVKTDRQATIAELLEDFANKDPKEIRHMALLLGMSGYGTRSGGFEASLNWANDASLDEVIEAYERLITDAAQMYGFGKKVTPTQILKRALTYRLGGFKGDLKDLTPARVNNLLVENGKMNGRIVGEEDVDLSGTVVRKYKSTSIIDPMDARELTRAMLQNELGRDPSEAEYEDFVSALQAAQRKDPDITTETTVLNEEGEVESQNSVTQQGIGAAGLQQLALQRAQSNPNWAEWQAMGIYAPALFDALGTTVPGV